MKKIKKISKKNQQTTNSSTNFLSILFDLLFNLLCIFLSILFNLLFKLLFILLLIYWSIYFLNHFLNAKLIDIETNQLVNPLPIQTNLTENLSNEIATPEIITEATIITTNNKTNANVTIPATTSIKTPDRYKTIIATISDEEIDLIAKIVFLEARGESDEGQQAVVEVIFNRIISDRFPNTISEVIFAQNQFTTVNALNYAKPTTKEYNNINTVLITNSYILDDDVVHFSGSPLNNKIYKKIGNHYFCRI